MKIFKITIVFVITFITLTLMAYASKEDNIIQFDSSNFKPQYNKDDNIKFYIASDIHYLDPSLKDSGKAFNDFVENGDAKELMYIDEITDAFVMDIKQNKPEFLIVSGDLTNNGEKLSHLSISDKFREIESFGTSVYVIPGNHDISNPWARKFEEDVQLKVDTINKDEFKKIYNEFGFSEAISRDKTTLSYLAAPSEDTWLLMLDTNKYTDNIKKGYPQVDGSIDSNTFEWINQCAKLAKDNNAQLITVMHHNILDHNPIINNGFTLNDNEYALKVFEENNMNIVLSGHIHIQDIVSTSSDKNTIYDITTSALSVYPLQYGIFEYSPSLKSYNYSTAIVDSNRWAKQNGLNDERLYDLNYYSKLRLEKRSKNTVLKNVTSDEGYTDEQKQLMIDTFINLNNKYYAGNDFEDSTIKDSKGFALLKESKSYFLRNYSNSAVLDTDLYDNNLIIPRTIK